MIPGRRALAASLSLTALLGCGGDTSVSICFGDVTFCTVGFQPVADAGPDQSVASGSLVTLDGSDSSGNIDSFSWAQTAGPAVALVNANRSVATFIAPFVASAATLSFQLTVVDKVKQADTDSLNVVVLP